VSKKKQTAAPKKTVATLDAKDCRWPFGDPRDEDFHFCGEPGIPGRPYCAHHWRMAFQPSAPRDRSKAVVLPRLEAA
jgi:GcrA cell cycle regulator